MKRRHGGSLHFLSLGSGEWGSVHRRHRILDDVDAFVLLEAQVGTASRLVARSVESAACASACARALVRTRTCFRGYCLGCARACARVSVGCVWAERTRAHVLCTVSRVTQGPVQLNERSRSTPAPSKTNCGGRPRSGKNPPQRRNRSACLDISVRSAFSCRRS